MKITVLDSLLEHMEANRALVDYLPTQEEMNAFFAEIDAEEKAKIDAHDALVDVLQGFICLLRSPSSPIRSKALAEQVKKAQEALKKAGVK